MTLFTFAEAGGVDSGTVLLTGILLLAIFLPTSFFFAYQLRKRRGAIPIKVRHPSLTFWLTICFCLKLSTSGSICLFLWKWPILSAQHIAYTPLLVADNIFLFSFLYLVIWRLWCIKYDLNWSKASFANNEWHSLINTNAHEYQTSSWYLKHKSTCCCPSYLCPFIPFIILLVIVNTPLLLYGHAHSITVWISRCAFALLIILMLLLHIITPKSIAGRPPKFELKKDLKAVFIVNILLLLVCIAGFVYELYYASQYEAFEVYNRANVPVLIEESLKFFGEWFLCMFQTFYVLIKTGEYIPFYMNRRRRGKTHVLGVMTGGNARQLSEILCNEKLFAWFVAHLASEFSINVMCALIEFLQFQRYCRDFDKANAQSNYESQVVLKSDAIRLPQHLPQSSIVFANAASHAQVHLDMFFSHALEKYHQLYCKYFNNKGSKLQLGFTPKIKQYFDGVLGNERKWLYQNNEINNLTDLMQHLDKSISEIYHLADDSFRRFLQINNQRLFQQMPEIYMANLSA